MNSAKVAIAASFAVLLILITGCTEKVSSTDTTDPTAETVQTEYCVLEYPEKYSDYVVITESELDGVHTIRYAAKFGESTYELFSVFFGNGGEGELYGYLSSGDEKVPVYIKCYTLPEENTLSDVQLKQFYEMMDAINTVTASISAAEGFIDS